jgi:hypothetical protein
VNRVSGTIKTRPREDPPSFIEITAAMIATRPNKKEKILHEIRCAEPKGSGEMHNRNMYTLKIMFLDITAALVI